VNSRDTWRVLGAALLISSLAACGSNAVRDGAPRSGSATIPDLPGDAVPRPEPRSRYGNGPVYEVFGERYKVMDSSAGFRQRGVASWYGTKFHGNLTAMREPYDMYAMTAAHKSLPLPTYVRVRNLRNDRSVVVRVNDRGPFVDNRIIDLSYSAALKLDMIRDGTCLVEIEAIDFDDARGDRPTRQAVPDVPPAPAGPATPAAATPAEVEKEHEVYAQVGAFGDRGNAERRLAQLRSVGIGTAFVVEDTSSTPALYRVRIGPIREVLQYDILVEELQNIGIGDPYLVTD
jgi:peptidoglycan lytic transglycosylase